MTAAWFFLGLGLGMLSVGLLWARADGGSMPRE